MESTDPIKDTRYSYFGCLVGGCNSHLPELDRFKTSRSDHTDTYRQECKHVGRCLPLLGIDVLLDRALCGPAGLTWMAAGPHNDRWGFTLSDILTLISVHFLAAISLLVI